MARYSKPIRFQRRKITTTQVVEFIIQHPELDVDELARELDVSRGTIYKRLAEIGYSFRSIRVQIGLPPVRDARLQKVLSG